MHRVHILSSSVCQPDAEDPGKEAKDSGCGEHSDQMTRAETLDPGEEPLVDNPHWTSCWHKKQGLIVLNYLGFKATGYESCLD